VVDDSLVSRHGRAASTIYTLVEKDHSPVTKKTADPSTPLRSVQDDTLYACAF
jgi:hypothetical protein